MFHLCLNFSRFSPTSCQLRKRQNSLTKFGTGKRGHYERGLFTGGISRISKMSRFSRISRKWLDSPLFSTVWGFSNFSRISKFSRTSRKWTFLKRPLFKKNPFFRTRLAKLRFGTPRYSRVPIEVGQAAQDNAFLKLAESGTLFGSRLRTLALKTENFSKKIGRFSKTRKWIY